MKHLFLILTFSLGQYIIAQTSPELNSAEILLGMKKLNTVGSVLYVAAHPDDENTRLLGYLAKEKNFRTGYLSLTRGDGGQNLIGKEQGEALGLIRTQELLAARRTDGAEQFFTRANDFGFSKNPEETFTIWNRDSILADVVLTIRRFKPDVIICRFPTTGEGGHGHHTASAILAMEAFDLAADPTKFPEQLKEVEVWQAKRIFWNTFNFGGNNTTSEDQLKLDVGSYNPLLGLNYGEVAANSRSMHKSQGFGSAKQRGENIEYFKLLKGESAGKDLFEGVNSSWKRIATTANLGDLINESISTFDPQHPEKSVSKLDNIYTLLQKLDEKDPNTRYWKKIKLAACQELIMQCAGLWMEAYASEYSSVPGNEINISAQIIARNPSNVTLKSISFIGQTDKKLDLQLTNNKLETIDQKEVLTKSTPYSAPYWLVDPHTVGMYTVNNPSLIGVPENQAAKSVIYHLNIDGIDFNVERGLVFKATDPVKGEVYRPFEILPPATITISDQVFVFNAITPKEVSFVVKANAANIKGTVKVNVPAGWKITIANPLINLVKKGDEQIVKAILTPDKTGKDGQLQASVSIDGTDYAKSITRIEYDHIPYQFILSDATAKIVFLDLKKTGNKIGYIPGAGDNVPACLTQIGYDVTLLTDELLAKEDLSIYSSIVTGVRAYNTNDRMPIYFDKLMAYVHQGGNLIVQYNTNNRIAPMETKIGPYPFTISRDRVTDDNATVEFTNPKHPVLNTPNVITQKDFEGWVQERGIYFATELDSHYETVFSMNDPNEKPSKGSLIIAKHGKGNFVYTGLVFFRELPAGIPGAYRLFVNLLSLPKN
ncbi:PIG-L family deacetylase [Fluviicola taffensis]|uniref:LmbE family protein n=1 Tax=Fluviicola taffensis (strain DSM 16823 / NCIMB 13979 / RW262) TaxID=755732 RepID=F2IH28_FLUTR|nr:PIG-L family deacetylase [Fluviicola taffensis]AEA45842.1 LmbE family protein [Fluviicola taffensis DSM 16823]